MAALEPARPVHVPTFSHSETIGNGLAVAVAPMSKGARPPGGKADTLVEGLIAGGNSKLLYARGEVGRGTENSRVNESESGGYEHMIPEGRKAAWTADFRRGRQDRRSGFASARGAVHVTRNRNAKISGVVRNDIVVEIERDDVTIEVEKIAAKRAEVGGQEPSFRVPPRNERTGVGRVAQGVVQGSGRK